jgi:hypothetical protein
MTTVQTKEVARGKRVESDPETTPTAEVQRRVAETHEARRLFRALDLLVYNSTAAGTEDCKAWADAGATLTLEILRSGPAGLLATPAVWLLATALLQRFRSVDEDHRDHHEVVAAAALATKIAELMAPPDHESIQARIDRHRDMADTEEEPAVDAGGAGHEDDADDAESAEQTAGNVAAGSAALSLHPLAQAVEDAGFGCCHTCGNDAMVSLSELRKIALGVSGFMATYHSESRRDAPARIVEAADQIANLCGRIGDQGWRSVSAESPSPELIEKVGELIDDIDGWVAELEAPAKVAGVYAVEQMRSNLEGFKGEIEDTRRWIESRTREAAAGVNVAAAGKAVQA